MQREEIRAAGRLAGGAVGGFAGLIGDFHKAVAQRTFDRVGLLGAPVRLIHDGVSGAAYRSVSRALQSTAGAGAGVVAGAVPENAASAASSPLGSMALGALNGAVGDLLAREKSELALEMRLRRRGRVVETSPEGIRAAYPRPSGKLAVFVHGLCGTDECWHVFPLTTQPGPRPTYGRRLRQELGYAPLYVRYNTGLHISDNGRALSSLLEEAVQSWPVPVDEVVLIGHSMGGLVSRSACHYGHADGARWADALRHVFCLGSPHLGAPLEKAANVASHAITQVPELAPMAKVVNGRSVGIKDLRFGSCVEEDWCDGDPDEFLRDRCNEVPFLDCATYYFIGATLTRSETDPIGSVVGDLLVRFASASGKGRHRRIPFELENGRHLGGLNHFDLINNPAVYEQMRAWLTRAPAPASA
jgi:pimeloyl-ACP methyl ester carboxylesterase